MDPQVLSSARLEFAKADPERMADLSGSIYIPDRKAIRLRYLNADYDLSHPGGEVAPALPSSEVAPVVPSQEINRYEQALMLQYLGQASGRPPADRWVAFAELPNGMLHDAPFRAEAVAPLVHAFASQPRCLVEAAGQLGGWELHSIGDVAIAVPVFPRILLSALLWLGDDEFPPQGNILFDASAQGYLSTASLYVLGVNLSEYLRAAAATRKE